MKKLLLIIIAISMACDSYSQNIVIDYECIKQVVANGTSATGQEALISHQTNESEKSQKKAAVAMTAIQTSVSLYRMALENVKAFGLDSRNVAEIARLAKLLASEIQLTTAEIAKNPKATIASYQSLAGVSEQALQSVQYCYSMVSNGTVKIPGFTIKAADNDGRNLLSAKERLEMCEHLIVNLKRLYFLCMQVRVNLNYTTTWGSVFRQALPFESYIIFSSQDIVDGIVKDFNSL